VLVIIDFWNSIELARISRADEARVAGALLTSWISIIRFSTASTISRGQCSVAGADHAVLESVAKPQRSQCPAQIDRGPDSQRMAVRALHDDKGRIMVIAFHNSDIQRRLGREGEQPELLRDILRKDLLSARP